MPEKQLIFDENARQSLMSGVDQLGRAGRPDPRPQRPQRHPRPRLDPSRGV